MLFNSVEFLLFFGVVLILFYTIPGKFRWVLLLGSSYFFYMSWEPFYILLIAFSTCVDYFISHRIYKEISKQKKWRLLILSLTVNLGLLFLFKYFNFFNDSIAELLKYISVDYKPVVSSLLLPVGISFYTFQTLSYTIDVYRGTLKPEENFGKFALYVSFFPQLVAGPIERASNLLPQFAQIRQSIKYSNVSHGFSQVIIGLFKKVVVADSAAIYVNSIFNNYEFHSGITLVLATYLFAVQIYCDFSGYSDMAIGIARMMGFKLMENFNLPYFSKSITEFWRRWHISLSSWLRDYLYITLGGNRKGLSKTYINLMITMLLGGLWHGASWNFVIWGFLNGLYLAIERFFNYNNFDLNRNIGIKWITSFITFNLVCLTWIFFRAETFDQAFYIISNIFQSTAFFDLKIQDFSVISNIVVGCSLLFVIEYFFLRKKRIEYYIKNKSLLWVSTSNSILILCVLLFGISNGSQFIYFQF